MDFLVPHQCKEEYVKKRAVGGKEKYLTAGVFVAFGIAIHNIPEGIAVAAPIYFATNSRVRALKFSFLSGMAEPIGAVVGLIILYPFMNAYLLSAMLVFVAGIMVFISFDELLPLSLKHGEEHVAIAGLFAGMFIMGASLVLIGG